MLTRESIDGELRFYQYGRRKQVLLTIFWIFILTLWVDICFGSKHPRYITLLLWSITGVLNLCSVWLNYWTVDEEGFAQHGLFHRRWFNGAGLTYAGPVRRSRLRWLLRKSVEIEMSGRTAAAPRFAIVADRAGFLRALRRIAPQADIVSPPAQ